MTYRVIVADSSPSVKKAVELAFPESEFEIFFFDNGLELVKALPDLNPDALLVSLSLPGMDGYQVAGYLRSQKEFRKSTLILLRGSFEKFEVDKAAGLDYAEVVRKPFDSEDLACRVKNLLDRQHDLLSFPEAPLAEGNGLEGVPGDSFRKGTAETDLAFLVRQEVKRALDEAGVKHERNKPEGNQERLASGKKAGRHKL